MSEEKISLPKGISGQILMHNTKTNETYWKFEEDKLEEDVILQWD